MSERYARQMQIFGWNQERLAQARIALIGSDALAGFIAWGLAALGIGHIFVLDDRIVAATASRFPFLETAVQQRAAIALATSLMTLNPDIYAYGIPMRLLYDAHAYAIPECDVLIEATNDAQSKQICLVYGRQRNIPVILASASPLAGMMLVANDHQEVTAKVFLDYNEQPQGVVPSQLIGGLVIGEVRRLRLPLPDDRPTQGIIKYHQTYPNRFGFEYRHKETPNHMSKPLHTLIVGGGALGTFAGLGIALAGYNGRLTIVDPDTIESTNLNRQLLFYQAVGRPKATTLAARLQQLSPNLIARGIVAKVKEAHLADVDIILLCVDNFATRALVNKWAVRNKIPLVNGGSSPFQGEVTVYQPGQTPCLNCRLGVNQLAEAEADRRTRCSDTPEPSIVVTNQIIGGLMAAEAAISAQLYENVEPLSGILTYDSTEPVRICHHSPRPACLCYEESAE